MLSLCARRQGLALKACLQEAFLIASLNGSDAVIRLYGVVTEK
jgi:hypothetical protein